MKIFFVVLVFIHALIHLLGFLKGFGIAEMENLRLPISRKMGVLWLMGSLGFLTYAILFWTNSKSSWPIGFLALLISQFLIILYWKDAKFATIPNLLVLVVTLMSWGQYRFQKLVHQETRVLLSHFNPNSPKPISLQDLEGLPEVVKIWLIQSGMLGKPEIQLGKVIQKAEMQLKPGQSWMKASANQYTNLESPSFLWQVEVKMNALLQFQGRDKFEQGKGEMLIKLNSLVKIVEEDGEKIDEGSLQRFLGEMVWFPSFALSPYLTWESLSDSSAKATLSYEGTEGSGTFYFNSKGEVTRFSAFRFQGNEPNSTRKEWIMDIEEYENFEGIKVPSKMKSTWKEEEGDWTWLKLEVIDILYNDAALNSN